jgi:hypothetical protein
MKLSGKPFLPGMFLIIHDFLSLSSLSTDFSQNSFLRVLCPNYTTLFLVVKYFLELLALGEGIEPPKLPHMKKQSNTIYPKNIEPLS